MPKGRGFTAMFGKSLLFATQMKTHLFRARVDFEPISIFFGFLSFLVREIKNLWKTLTIHTATTIATLLKIYLKLFKKISISHCSKLIIINFSKSFSRIIFSKRKNPLSFTLLNLFISF